MGQREESTGVPEKMMEAIQGVELNDLVAPSPGGSVASYTGFRAFLAEVWTLALNRVPTRRGYLIINIKNGEYVFTDSESWDGDWKQRYPHVANLDYWDIETPSIWPHDTINGFPFVYDLTRDGGLFTLYVDADASIDDIRAATAALRGARDVVSLRVMKLKPAQRGRRQ